jgi:NAD(P)-dependent dehydrogenase (short-subunit alcohol dehydrogenase family)
VEIKDGARGVQATRRQQHHGRSDSKGRDEGTAAVEQIKQLGHTDVIFQQLDMTDASRITRLADFLKTRVGKLDILVSFSSFDHSICRYRLWFGLWRTADVEQFFKIKEYKALQSF